MRAIAVAAAAAVLIQGHFAQAPAMADWVKAESDNFVVYSEMDAQTAADTVRELEMFRETVLTLMGKSGTPEVRKVHVFGVKNERAVGKLTGLDGAAGVYTSGEDHPLFVTVAGKPTKQDDLSRTIMLHEFSHHVTRGHTSELYPRWYAEGFAEYLSSFYYEGDVVTLGRPSSRFGNILNKRGWASEDYVFDAIFDYPEDFASSRGSWRDSVRGQYFYGISWLGVHYLLSTPELSGRIGDYIGLINDGVPSDEAFERGLGMTQSEFRGRIFNYWQQDSFPMIRFSVKDAFAISDISVTEISDAEAEIARTAVMATFRREARDLERAADEIRELIDDEGPHGRLYHSLMSIALKQGDHDGAVEAGEAAVAALPGDPLALQTLADAKTHRFLAERSGDGEADRADADAAIDLFEGQLAIEPDSPTANAHLPMLYLLVGKAPTQTLVDAVSFNIRRDSTPRNFGAYLDGAEVMKLVGATAEQCALLKTVDTWIRAADGELTEETRAALARRGDETALEKLERLGAGCGPAGD